MEVQCYRCSGKIELSKELNIMYSSMQRKKIVCDNCLSWYRTGGVNGGNVELPFLMTTYDRNNVKLFDLFNREDEQEKNLKKAREVFFNSHNLKDKHLFIAAFNEDTEEQCFFKVKQFLKENWITEIPLPANARRLWWDYIQPDENGNFGSFVWHPIKITQDHYQENGLILSIYNEDYPHHMDIWEGNYDYLKSEE